MASTRRILGKRLPSNRLVRLVTRRARFGKRIQLQQVGTVPQSDFERLELLQIQEEIQKHWKSEFGSKKIVSLLSKAKVLQASLALRKELGGRNPSVYQVLSLTALRYGLDSPELKQQATKMLAMWRRSKVFWDGSPGNIYMAMQVKLSHGQRLPSSIEKILFQNKKSVDAKTMTEQVGLKWGPKSWNDINSSLQLLETAGLIKKMPEASFENPRSVWFHTAHKNPPVDYPNIAIDTIRRLLEGPKTIFELSKIRTRKVGSKVYSAGLESGKYSDIAIGRTLPKLASAGLIHLTKTTKSGYGRHAGGKVPLITVSITSLGQRLLKEHDQNNSLPEWGRKLLLGEKETEPLVQ